MKLAMPDHAVPAHGVAAQERSPVICYPADGLRQADLASYRAARVGWKRARTVLVPPREARCFAVAAGEFFRISNLSRALADELGIGVHEAEWHVHRVHAGHGAVLHDGVARAAGRLP
jgi:uncharacterized protein YcgI (DUF1989 family)